MEIPETIENRWDILYRDYPDVYEAFSRFKKTPVTDIAKEMGVEGKVVVDVASGTGTSTITLARLAKKAIGIEPEPAMMKIAREKKKELGIKNVVFKKGTSDSIPLGDSSVDMVVAVTSASFYSAENITRFVNEAERVLVTGGSIKSWDIAPGWYGGDLAPVILGKSRRHPGNDTEFIRDKTFTALGFKYKDYFQTQEYDTLDNIISTYGFIFGKKAIEYLKVNNRTYIKWKNRLYFKNL